MSENFRLCAHQAYTRRTLAACGPTAGRTRRRDLLFSSSLLGRNQVGETTSATIKRKLNACVSLVEFRLELSRRSEPCLSDRNPRAKITIRLWSTGQKSRCESFRRLPAIHRPSLFLTSPLLSYLSVSPYYGLPDSSRPISSALGGKAPVGNV